MSIRDQIAHLTEIGSLVHLVPKRKGAGVPRVVLLDRGLHEAIVQPEPNKAERMGRLRADLDHFTTGGFIVVGKGRQNECFLKLLSPVADGICELRSRNPKPSLRLLGGFAEIDVFVGMSIHDRNDLGAEGSREWRDAIVSVKSAWSRSFISYPRVSGGTFNDYLSRSFIDEDNI